MNSSFGVIPTRLLFSSASDRAKVLYGVLERYVDMLDADDDVPDHNQLAEDLYCTAAEAKAALDELVDSGWVLRGGSDLFLQGDNLHGKHICGNGRTSIECPACVQLDQDTIRLRRRQEDQQAPLPQPTAVRRKQKIEGSLRRAVFERDAYRCRLCLTWKDLAVDHVYPESLGGPTELGNLQTLCRPCNSRKGVRVP